MWGCSTIIAKFNGFDKIIKLLIETNMIPF